MREETRQHLGMAARSIDAARDLVAGGHPDFALARGYYAMFYTAEALLAERKMEFSKHGGVHGAFGREFAKTGALDPKYHQWLLAAFSRRVEADYHPGAGITAGEAEETIRHAEEFLAAARPFLQADD